MSAGETDSQTVKDAWSFEAFKESKFPQLVASTQKGTKKDEEIWANIKLSFEIHLGKKWAPFLVCFSIVFV